jgi:hypothetical protein
MRNRVLLPYLILLLGLCFTLVVYYYFYKLTYEQDRIRFDSSVQGDPGPGATAYRYVNGLAARRHWSFCR